MGATFKATTSLLVSIALWPALACMVIPVRVPQSTRNAFGDKEELDFSFLKAGTTTRDDVTKHLGAIDTGVNERFFWGRWQSSKWYVVAGTMSAAGGDRVWSVHNILIQFDAHDIVSDWTIIGSNELDRRLDSMDEHGDFPLNLPQSLLVDPRWSRSSTLAQLSLKEESIEYAILDLSLTTARGNIDKVSSSTFVSDNGDPAKFVSDTKMELCATLHFRVPVESRYVPKKRKAKVYKTRALPVRLNPYAYLLLRRYVRQTAHNSQSAGN